MIHIILFQPEIPQNTGNIGRMCAITQSRLHLIHPLGFEINDRNLRRAGMDYWYDLDVHEHADWEAFCASPQRPQGSLYLFTTHSHRTLWDVCFRDGDGLLFGSESAGVPEWLHEACDGYRLKIPHWNSGLRSLNLSTAAGIATYEALRQGSRDGWVHPGV